MPTPYVLTNATLDVLKNFASINNQTVFKAGTAQRTCNAARNFIADAEFDDPLPLDCSLSELNRLLGIIDTCKGIVLPTLTFNEKELVVVHDDGSVTIPYAHNDVVAKPPTQQYYMPNPIATFDLSLALWTKMRRTAAVLGTTLMHIIIEKKQELTLKLVNEKDKGGEAAGTASYRMANPIVSGEMSGVWGVKFDALELMPGNYSVSVGDISTTLVAPTGPVPATIFGMFFKLIDPTKKMTYLTSGHVVKTR